MSKLNVTLITHTPDPEKTIAVAAKMCYSNEGVNGISDKLGEEKIENFLNMLVEIGHESPIEHVSFTFGIEGVSRSLLAQITRHRMASFSVKSQRYVAEGQFSYIIPPEIEKNSDALKIFTESMEMCQKNYNILSDKLYKVHYLDFLALGKDEKTAEKMAEKKAIEDARFVLPNACETKMVVTMNARSLMNFFNLRCCERAQWEIRELAEKMLMLVKEAAPTLFKLAGPACLKGNCPEGKMSCGKMLEKRKFFLKNSKICC